jgi:Ca2+-binding RTX toxin-like protein
VANIFDIQGFGALSEWNGQFSSASANQAFQTIASLGSNSIELSARIWTQSATTNTVIADPAKTESDASLLAGFQAAHAAGLSVVFKAAISSLSGTPTSSLAPSDVGSFFASYKAEIVHLASIAQAGGVQTFAIGNEMSSLSGQPYRGYWTDLISAVRQVYHGELTYAAATDEASKVSFWDQVDTIGVNTYPPLTSSNTPTVQDLVHAWSEVPINPYYAAAFEYKSPVDFLHALSEQYGKPVLMTEVGYRSIDGTAIAPGSWTGSGTPNAGAQADAYNAFFQVWTAHGGSWLKGVEFWQWDLNNQPNTNGYSVMGKPAEAVVSQYFHGNGTVTGLTTTGSSVADIIDLGQGNDVINGGLGDDVIHGGAGNDVISGGPSVAGKLSTTTITLTGYGSVVGGIGAQVQILVNGKAVSGLFEFKPATDPSGYQTFTVSFSNPGAITSIDIALVNSASGRALHLKDFSINGVALGPGDGTNASSPGSFDLYVRSIHFDTTNHQDWFFGASTDNDVIYGGAGNDMIIGGIGNDVIDGGDGIDTAVFAGNISDYNISVSGNVIVVTDKIAGRDGTDHLTSIEFLKFADSTISTSNLAATPSGLSTAGSLLAQAADGAGNTAAGNTTSETVRHADGSRDVYTSAIAGKDYASEHDVISSSGVTTLIERFFADGDLAFRQAVNSDGSVDSADYDAAGHLTRFAARHVDGSFDQFTFDASGAITNETIRHADGSRDLYSYGLTGKDYTSQHVANDASGHSVLIEDFRADGSLTLKQTVDAAGGKTLDQYDGAGHLAQETVTQKDGTYLQSSYADGTLSTATLGHADGSRDIYSYGIVGKGYSSQHVIDDASGHSVLIEDFRADGSLSLKQTVDAGGVTTLDRYDGLGHIVQQTMTQKDGTYVQSSYASDGSLTAETTGHLDGSRAVDTYGIKEQAYSARHDDIDASGHRLATTFDNNDGSHTVTAYASGVTLTSGTTNDFMNSAGGDTFVFKQASGHDVINNFKAGDAAGHDVIEIASALAADLAHLSIHIVGHDTVIDLGHDASITLTGVVTPLTQHDLLIT